jgi:hypothetical protein
MDKPMSNRLAKIFGLIIAWIGLSQSAAFACMCVGLPTPNDYLRDADVVFAGRVIDKEIEGGDSRIRFDWSPPFIHLTDLQLTEGYDKTFTVFEVTRVWKGDILARTSVDSSSPCGYDFRLGEEYIVYAKWFEGKLHTGMCQRNNELRNASADLAAFGAGKPPAPNPSLAPDYIRALIAVLLAFSLLGWATWRAHCKFGVQKS